MRLLLIAAAVILMAPSIARAKPSVAVAPLDGDTNNKVGNAVAKAAEDEASAVTGPKETGKAMEKLDLSGTLDKKDAKKLRAKLDVEILIQGKVEDDGDDKSIQLTVAGKGLKSSKLKLRFKTVSTKFRNDLREALAKRLAPARRKKRMKRIGRSASTTATTSRRSPATTKRTSRRSASRIPTRTRTPDRSARRRSGGAATTTRSRRGTRSRRSRSGSTRARASVGAA